MASVSCLLALCVLTLQGHSTPLAQQTSPSNSQVIAKGSGTVTALKWNTHHYQLYQLDLTDYASGELTIEVSLGAGQSGASYDLFANEADVPTTGRPEKSLKGGYDVRPNGKSRLRYSFTKPCQLIFGIEGNWLSKVGTTNTYDFQITILGQQQTTNHGSQTKQRRLFFFICYSNKDKKDSSKYQSFPYAARTWESEVKSRYSFSEKTDKFIPIYVMTAGQFIQAWDQVKTDAEREEATVVAGAVFSHASYIFKRDFPLINLTTGLEFGIDEDAPSASSTLGREAIEALPVLPWSKEGSLELAGCFTGYRRPSPIDGWCPAEAFAKRQHVVTWGEPGFSSFSQSKDKYIELKGNVASVYLHTYNSYLKGQIGLGSRKPPIMFLP